MSGLRILLTGATGGLGIACARELIARGHQVRAAGRNAKAGQTLGAMGTQFAAIDLEQTRDFSSLFEGCDSVIHAAALSASWGPREAFQRANLDVTARLLDAASESGVRRFVFISSPSIFADFKDRNDIGEDDAPTDPPLNHYARTKLTAERLVLAERSDGMACCAIRPRALVGEGDRVILPKLAEMAQRKRIPMPRGGKALIELTDLRDAAWAICEAEERAQTLHGRAINISGGQPLAVREVAQKLAQALGQTPKYMSPPTPLLRALATALETVARVTGQSEEPALTGYTLATLAYSQSFDLNRAKRLLGFTPRFDGLATLLEQARRVETREENA